MLSLLVKLAIFSAVIDSNDITRSDRVHMWMGTMELNFKV